MRIVSFDLHQVRLSPPGLILAPKHLRDKKGEDGELHGDR